MDTVIVTAAVASSVPTVAAEIPASSSVPAVEWMSHKFLHWHDDCEDDSAYRIERARVLAPIAAAFFTGGEEAVIKATSGSNHSDVTHCWCLAMNAIYGSSRIHESWMDERGRPSAECLAKFPDVAAGIERARANLRSFLRVYD